MGNINPYDEVDLNPADENGGDYRVFEPGTYVGSITKVDMSKTSNGVKTKGATMLRVDSDFIGDNGSVTSVIDFMILHSNTLWKIKKFFRSVGLIDEDQSGKGVLPFNALVPGLQFVAELDKESYTNNNGEEKYKNTIKNYLKPSQANQFNQQDQGGTW